MQNPKSYRSDAKIFLLDEPIASFNAKVQPRGKYSRQNCFFKPLDIRKLQNVDANIFNPMYKEIKVTTECDHETDVSSRKYSIAEVYGQFASQHIVSLLTPFALKAQWVNIKYESSSPDSTETYQVYGFIREHKRDLIKRTNSAMVKLTREEETAPFTEEEMSSTRDYRHRYGDYIADKYIYKYRIKEKARRELMRLGKDYRWDFFREIFQATITSLGDHRWGWRNEFPIVGPNGKVMSVFYDLDRPHVETFTNEEAYQRNLQSQEEALLWHVCWYLDYTIKADEENTDIILEVVSKELEQFSNKLLQNSKEIHATLKELWLKKSHAAEGTVYYHPSNSYPNDVAKLVSKIRSTFDGTRVGWQRTCELL